MEPLIASPADAGRLLKLYSVEALADVVQQMLEWGDAPAFLDDAGQLCVPDEEPNSFPRQYLTETELQEQLRFFDIEKGDLVGLRRRMILEESWAPNEIGIEDGRIFTAVDPDGR